MEDTILDLILDYTKKMYVEMQENHRQVKERLVALEKDIAEIKAKTNENSKSIEKELEDIQEKITEIRYRI